MNRAALTVMLMLTPAASFAAVGKAVLVEGSATRTPKGGAPVALAAEGAIELHDTIEVKKGNLKLQLNDNSVLMLGENSKLEVNEADFAGQERKSFSAKLFFGKIWNKVSKTVGGAKYEVTTERAVAGVRGTIFRIDTDTLVRAAAKKPGKKPKTTVSVNEGLVAVAAKVKKPADDAPAKPKGPRKQIAAPMQEITADQWEEKFTELKKNMRVTIGEDSWEEASIPESEAPDSFQSWVEKNQ
jgi:hypothetical protein